MMCVKSGSHSSIYSLTNLVGVGSKAQLVVLDFITNLRTSSSETTANVFKLAHGTGCCARGASECCIIGM